MSASLVGSEMCIRDRGAGWSHRRCERGATAMRKLSGVWAHCHCGRRCGSCLLYTSDAADDM
eukprot:7826355-Alexandrium_andersonii.AAC.1